MASRTTVHFLYTIAIYIFIHIPRSKTFVFLNCGQCVRGDSLICPNFTEQQFEVKLLENYDGSLVHLTITCSNIVDPDFSLLKGCNFPTVNFLDIEYCPLPNSSLVHVAEKIGVIPERIQYLTIYYPRTNAVTSLSVDFFDRFSNLAQVTLDSTKLTNLPENIFSPTVNLEELYIRGNSLKEFKPKTFHPLAKLRKLVLNHNSLQSLDEKLFQNLIELKSLYIWYNNITKLPSTIFHPLKNLRNITFQNNNLTKIVDGLFSKNPHLENVNLKRNKLKILPEKLFFNNTKIVSLKLNNNELQRIPKEFFSKLVNLEEIEIKSNNLTNITDKLFAYNVKLVSLILSKNHLSNFSGDFFAQNNTITNLDLSFNSIGNISSSAFSRLRSVKVIDISHNELTFLPDNLFLRCSALEELFISNNKLSVISLTSFPQRDRSYLKIIDLSYNYLNTGSVMYYGIFSLNHQIQLEEINLSHNNFTSFPSQALFHNYLNLKTLNFESNQIERISFSTLLDLANEATVNLRFNKISQVETFYKNEVKNIYVYLKGNPFICDCRIYEFATDIQNENAHDLSKYQYAKISHNHETKNNSSIPDKTETSTVKVLDKMDLICGQPPEFSGQFLNSISSESLFCSLAKEQCSHECPCSYWPARNTIKVNCSSKSLVKVPSVIYVPKYDYHLDLSNNSITSLNFSIGDPVTNLSLSENNITSNGLSNQTVLPERLKYIDLSNNFFSHVDEGFLWQIGNRDIKIDFSNNPWQCDCSIKYIHNFIQAEYIKFVNIRNVSCHDENGSRPLVDLTEDDICPLILQPVVLTSIGVVTSLLLIMAVVATVLFYRYKTRLKVWLYSHQMCLNLITETEMDVDKTYDAFVSYSHKDEEFVNNILVPGLESGEPPYRLCLHYRDWMAGEYIPNQIIDSVQASRRTLVVLSKNFIESVWAQMEFRAAHQQALQDKTNRVIVVVYGDMPPISSLDEELQHYVTLHTYVKWGDVRFWPNLRYAMPHKQNHSKPRNHKQRLTADKIELVNGHTKLSVNGVIAANT